MPKIATVIRFRIWNAKNVTIKGVQTLKLERERQSFTDLHVLSNGEVFVVIGEVADFSSHARHIPECKRASVAHAGQVQINERSWIEDALSSKHIKIAAGIRGALKTLSVHARKPYAVIPSRNTAGATERNGFSRLVALNSTDFPAANDVAGKSALHPFSALTERQ